jgi:hypothetical protein
MNQAQMKRLEQVLADANIRDVFWPAIIRGVDDLGFVPEGYVVLTDDHRRAFREAGRKTADLDEFLDNNTTGEFGAIVSTPKGISAIWCFEELGDAAMFKLTYGIA